MRLRKTTNTFLMIALVGVLLGIASPALATILLPNDPNTYPPDVFAMPGGVMVADTGSQSYAGATFRGRYREQVWSDPLNPFCAGCLTFIFQFSNDGPGTLGQESITRSTTADFTGWQTDAGYVDRSSGITPISVDRKQSGVIGFNYTPLVSLLQQSAIMVVATDALSYKAGTIGLIDGTTVTVPGYAPAVPEVSSILLLGTGLFAAGTFVRLRRRKG